MNFIRLEFVPETVRYTGRVFLTDGRARHTVFLFSFGLPHLLVHRFQNLVTVCSITHGKTRALSVAVAILILI